MWISFVADTKMRKGAAIATFFRPRRGFARPGSDSPDERRFDGRRLPVQVRHQAKKTALRSRAAKISFQKVSLTQHGFQGFWMLLASVLDIWFCRTWISFVADTKMRKGAAIAAFIRPRGGFARRRAELPDEGENPGPGKRYDNRPGELIRSAMTSPDWPLPPSSRENRQ